MKFNNNNNKYYENYNKSQHLIRRDSKPVKHNYKLSPSGYLTLDFKDISVCYKKYRYYTINDKASFLITLICNFMQNEKIAKGETDFEILSQKEFSENEEIKYLFNLLETKLPKCKGVRMKRNSFKDGYCNYRCDNSHTKKICSLKEYLHSMGITLDEFLFNPVIFVNINPQYCDY